MTSSKDERYPFTCTITKEDCGSMIDFLELNIVQGKEPFEPLNLGGFPISPEVSILFTTRNKRKLINILKKELEKIVKEKN